MPTDNDRKRLRALASAVDSAENKGGGWWVVNACHLATGVLALLDQLEAVERERDGLRRLVDESCRRGSSAARECYANSANAAWRKLDERLAAIRKEAGL